MLTNHEMENEGRPRNATVIFEEGSTYKPHTRCSSVVCVFKGSDNGRAQCALGERTGKCKSSTKTLPAHKESGWKTSVLSVEVSCIAFPSQSL